MSSWRCAIAFLEALIDVGLHSKSVPTFRRALPWAQRNRPWEIRIESWLACGIAIPQGGWRNAHVGTDIKRASDPVALEIERIHGGSQQ